MLMKHYSYETWAESYIELMCIAANVREWMAIESPGDADTMETLTENLKAVEFGVSLQK